MKTITYYLRAIPTLLFGIKNPLAIIAASLGQRPILRLADGLKLQVANLMDIWIAKETCLDHDYEVFGCKIEDDWVVVDIGAAFGDFVAHTAFHHPKARVIAFEPFAKAFALLRENIALNQLHNVTIFDKAVSSRAGKLVVAQTGAAVQHTTRPAENGAADSALVVNAITLNDIFNLTNIDHINFLKVDCEGAEFDIFLNTNAVELNRIDHICLEYHDNATSHHHSALVNHFKYYGFEVKTQQNQVHSHLGFLYAQRSKP